MTRRTVLVTGASSGIGRAVALRLDAGGWGVYAGVRSTEGADELAAAASPRLRPVQLDVTVPEQIAAVASQIQGEAGSQGLGALVNNAGIAVGGPLDYLDLDELRRVLEVNTVAPIAMVQALREPLRAAKGRIVMMSSVAARISAPNMGPYSASKSALSSLSEALRAELRSAGVKVAVVEPGAIDTEIWRKAQDYGERLRSSLPADALDRHGRLLSHSEKVVAASAEHATSVDAVAGVVEKALTVRFPRSRYLVGRDARAAGLLLRFVPDRVRTAIVRRV